MVKPFRFKPNKKIANDGGLGRCNKARAAGAEEMIKFHPLAHEYRNEDDETKIGDFLADLFHLCDKLHVDVDEVIERAKMHWEEER